MITATSRDLNVRTTITNGRVTATSDLPVQKGGRGEGFGAHELLEAALASCISMTAQMAAIKHGIPLNSATCTVRIDRSEPGTVSMVYDLNLVGDLSEDQCNTIRSVVADCPVSRTLSGKLAVRAESL
jgi:putative redox protein